MPFAISLRSHSPVNAEGMIVVTRWEGTIDSDLPALGVELRPTIDSFTESILAWHKAGLITGRHIGKLTDERIQVV